MSYHQLSVYARLAVESWMSCNRLTWGAWQELSEDPDHLTRLAVPVLEFRTRDAVMSVRPGIDPGGAMAVSFQHADTGARWDIHPHWSADKRWTKRRFATTMRGFNPDRWWKRAKLLGLREIQVPSWSKRRW